MSTLPTLEDLERFLTKAEELLSPADKLELVRLIESGNPDETFAFLHTRIPDIHRFANKCIEA